MLELIRGRRLKERYALLWLLTGLVLLVLSAWRGGLNTIAGWLGVGTYPPAILFAAATLFVILVLLHYSTVLSRLADQNVLLAQQVALLDERVRRAREPLLRTTTVTATGSLYTSRIALVGGRRCSSRPAQPGRPTSRPGMVDDTETRGSRAPSCRTQHRGTGARCSRSRVSGDPSAARAAPCRRAGQSRSTASCQDRTTAVPATVARTMNEGSIGP